MRPTVGEVGLSTRITPRLLDLIGLAMAALYLAALAGMVVALWLNASGAAEAFVTAMIGCALTLCAIGLFERRLS